jgi:hypothetical protein
LLRNKIYRASHSRECGPNGLKTICGCFRNQESVKPGKINGMRNSKGVLRKTKIWRRNIEIGYENQQSMAEKAPQIGYAGTFRIRPSRSMEKTIFLYRFFELFLRYFT